MRLLIIGLVALTAAAIAFADDAIDRSKLIGAWQLQTSPDKASGTVWTFEEKGDSMHVVVSENNGKVADFECNVEGRECEIKESGKQAKISMWYSGPKLVELETRGSDTVKRRFGIKDTGDMMEIEIIPVVPAGKTEVLTLKRVH